ncbi:MAG: TetR/AcrR family transcriptional regulator [Frankiales bacterium]|nr:TetR/AcrR family transcriptional regulator [Frankiales bacterium]
MVIDLIREVGYESLTLDAVAARGRTSKATLYRQWQGKPGLVVAALQNFRPKKAPPAPTGTLDGDLDQFARHANGWDKRDAAITYGLMHAAATDREFGDTVRTLLIEPAIVGLSAIFERAVERGEIADQPAVFRQLAISLVSHHLFGGLLAGPLALPTSTREHINLVIKPALTYLPSTAHQPAH